MIIFDMDGTLWNTVDITLEAANEIAIEYPEVKKVSKSTVESGMGLSSEENAHLYMPYLNKEKAIYYLEKISEKCSLLVSEKGANIYDGVQKVIEKLSSKYKLAIVTNNYNEYAETFLNKTGLKEYFTDYMGTASYGITKAEGIKTICKRNKAYSSYYIGDIEKDKIAAEEAGIKFIHAKYGFDPQVKSELFINDIKELPDLLSSIDT